MPFSTTLDQRKYFHEHRYIEFESLVLPQEVTKEGTVDFSLQKKFATLAANLTDLRPICRATTFFLKGGLPEVPQATLADLIALQSPIFGLMLCLEPGSLAIDDTPSPLFSNRAGNGVFFSDELAIDFAPLYTPSNRCYLLVVFTEATPVVLTKEHSLAWKPPGSVQGDRYNASLLLR